MLKNIIIDGQILQTNAWYRGMGKYSLQLIRTLSKLSHDELKVFVIFNDNIQTEEERFKEVQMLCPGVSPLHYRLPLPINGGSRSKTYQSVLSNKISKDILEGENYFLITSLFTLDIFVDYPDNCHKLLLFYDLTPLLFWRYLSELFPPTLYMARFQEILEAEMIVTISETTRQDLLKVFGLDAKRIVTINGGPIEIALQGKKLKNLKIPKNYILFPTGDLPHKNNLIAVQGYTDYATKHNRAVALLLTSYFSDQSKQELLNVNNKIIFTNNVTDEELEWLYDNAKVVLFASHYEGLGIPVLDAVAKSKPVIVSRIPIFEEMSRNAFYSFDPNDSRDLAIAIHNAIGGQGFSEKQVHYQDILNKYSWPNTCKRFMQAINSPLLSIGKVKPRLRPKIAVLSPYPGFTGPGRLAEVLYYNFSKEFEVDYYFDKSARGEMIVERPSFLDYIGAHILGLQFFGLSSYRYYDLTVYLIDRSTFPSRIAELACVLPGYVIIDISQKNVNPKIALLTELALKNHYKVQKYYFNNQRRSIIALIDSIHKVILDRRNNPKQEDLIIMRAKNNKEAVSDLIKIIPSEDSKGQKTIKNRII
ncbi:MAG: glycosyltransferase family 4 protein [Patescibacteria group bacterium]|jgi:glycosyltransferase involved in cell wall biosynthesis|nr:glycosyltransferase family 4 protein [Patescibacteria group bacterium]